VINKRFALWSSNLLIYSTAVLGILALINYISYRHYSFTDMTPDKKYSLSQQSTKIMKNLKQKVKVTAFVKELPELRSNPKRLFEQYQRGSDKFSWTFVDPDKEPLTAKKFGVKRYDTFVVESASTKRFTGVLSESELTNMIIGSLSNKKKVIYFIKGHGEKDIEDKSPLGFFMAEEELKKENFKTASLVTASAKKIPDDASLVILAGPQTDLFKGEEALLDDYLKRGGKLMFLADPMTIKKSANFTKKYGINLSDDIVLDKLSKALGGDYTTPAVTDYGKHEITKDFSMITFYPIARSLKIADSGSSFKVTPLAKTINDSWGETDFDMYAKGKASFNKQKDNNGPLVIVAVSQLTGKEKKGGVLFVAGDSDFVANAYIGQNGNKDFFMNSISWLAGEDSRIAIRAKNAKMDVWVIPINTIYGIGFLVLFIAPIIVISIGTVINLKRRRA